MKCTGNTCQAIWNPYKMKTYNDQLKILYWVYWRAERRMGNRIKENYNNVRVESFGLNIVWMLRHPSAIIKLIKEDKIIRERYED